jgi:predicted RND superfamily exporter protein
MVMGLGTDFTIVMYARYVEERRQGRSRYQSNSYFEPFYVLTLISP